jgi:hypothetical protein
MRALPETSADAAVAIVRLHINASLMMQREVNLFLPIGARHSFIQYETHARGTKI